MAEKVYIAADLGAESGRAIAGKFDGEKLSLEVAHRFLNIPLRLPHALCWNIGHQYAEILNGIKAIYATYGEDVKSVSVDTWGVDFGLLDETGALTALPVHYRDKRNVPAFDELRSKLGDPEIYNATGLQFMPFNSLYQLYAMSKTQREVLNNAKKLLFMPDIFHYWLSGVGVVESTIASTSSLVDPRTCKWAVELLDKAGIPSHFLPEIVQPGTILGEVRDDVVFDTKAKGVKVVVPGSHDTASAVAAVPVSREDGDYVYMSSGTWSLMGMELKSPIINEDSRRLNFTNEGGVENTIRFLRNIAGLWLVQELRRAYERDGAVYNYTELTQMAAEAQEFRSLVDPDDMSFMAPADMRAAVADFCKNSNQPVPETPGQFNRACLESLAMRYRWVVERLRELTGKKLDTLHIVGGGTQNKLLCQFTANATGCRVLAGPIEATAAGNVLLQMIAMGDVKNLAEARELIRRSFEVYEFTPQSKEKWDAAYERWLKVAK